MKLKYIHGGLSYMSNEREQLLLDLKRIGENEYELSEGEKAWDYVPSMLKYIGDTDSELRDDLIYSTFCEWIFEKEYISKEELRRILSVLIDENHLFYNIGNDGDDTVLTRSFSVLNIAMMLCYHREENLLEYDMLMNIKDNLIRYYESEKDFRGYLGEKGWAHAAAHGADVMDELVQCKECNEEVYNEILGAVKKVLYNPKHFFSNEEDERITRSIFRIIKENKMSYESISNWIEGLSECCDWERNRSQYVARVNTKNFIRCLYFKLMHYDNSLDIINTVFKVEERLNRFLEVDEELLSK